MRKIATLFIAVLTLVLVLGFSCVVFGAEDSASSFEEASDPVLAGAEIPGGESGIWNASAYLYQQGSFAGFSTFFSYDYTAFNAVVLEALERQDEEIDM